MNQALKNSSGYDIRLLGKGGYGTVVLGSWKNMRVAVKVIARDDKTLSKSRRRTSIDSEMNATRIPEHENIVKVHGIFNGLEELHSSLIVMEYVGHYNLQNVIESQPHKLQHEKFFHRAVTEIGRGLQHCHRNGIVHLDIKPSNVLVISSSKPSGSWYGSCSSSCSSVTSSDGVSAQFKIGDFGCSKQATNRKRMTLERQFNDICELSDLSRPLGTPGYQSPEMLNGKGPITSKCDIYSYGILFWQLLTKTSVPYQGMHQHTVIFKVVSQGLRPNYRDTYQSNQLSVKQAHKDAKAARKNLVRSSNSNQYLRHDSVYQQIFQQCWQQEFYNRPSIDDVLYSLDSIKLSTPRTPVVTSNVKLGYNTCKQVHRINRHSNPYERRLTANIRY